MTSPSLMLYEGIYYPVRQVDSELLQMTPSIIFLEDVGFPVLK
jgi:hypothetical protein